MDDNEFETIRVFVDSGIEIKEGFFRQIMFTFGIMLSEYHQIIDYIACHVFDPNYHQITDWAERHNKDTGIIADYHDGYRATDTVLLVVDDVIDCYNKVEYLVKHNKRVFIYCQRTNLIREVQECTSQE